MPADEQSVRTSLVVADGRGPTRPSSRPSSLLPSVRVRPLHCNGCRVRVGAGAKGRGPIGFSGPTVGTEFRQFSLVCSRYHRLHQRCQRLRT